MKKIEKGAEILWLLGILTVALGVAICSKADLGVSMIAAPAFIVNEYVIKFFPQFSVGMTEYSIQGIMLLLMCLIVGKFTWKYLLSFLAAVIYGYTLDFFIMILGGISAGSLPAQWCMLLLGDMITAFGVACFFRTYLPLQVYELFVAEVASCKKLDIIRTKRAFDISLLVISAVLAAVFFGDFENLSLTKSFHSLGAGTVVTTVINSVLIRLFGNLLDRVFGSTPAFPFLYKVLDRGSR